MAVNPDVDYVVAQHGEERLVVAEPLLRALLGEDTEVLATVPGRELERTAYRRPFDLVDISESVVRAVRSRAGCWRTTWTCAQVGSS